MKKSLRFCVLLALAAALLTVSAFADTGPKAQLKVLVKNAPEEPYYLDLLEKGDYQGHTYGSGDGDDTYSGLDWSYSEEEIAALDDELLDALRAAVPEGWHACTARRCNRARLWIGRKGPRARRARRLPISCNFSVCCCRRCSSRACCCSPSATAAAGAGWCFCS